LFLTTVALIVGPAIRVTPPVGAGEKSALQDLFSASIADDEAAFVFLGYSAIIVRTVQGTVIIDPADIISKEEMDNFRGKKVNAVLYTHSHGDHFKYDAAVALSQVTGAPVCGEGAVIQAMKRGGAIPSERIVDLSSGRPQTLSGLEVTPIRGSHVGPIILFHLKAGEIEVFHGGDSAYVPMKNLSAGLAFLPAGDPSPTASPDDALKMAQDLKPRVVVAIHGSEAQYRELAKKIKSALPGTEVIIPVPMKLYTVKVT
jgi:L-ascorbate metabolism protein UlaG (beta-lactamase superfamily)